MRKRKYQEIASALRKDCAAQADGARLPSERDLGTRFDVSPMTVRRALEELESEGRVTRIPGRGTFAQRSVIAKADFVSSFTEDMHSRGLTPGTRLLGVEFTEAGAVVARDLKIKVGTQVLQVERLRLADEEPMCLELAHLPGRIGQQLLDRDGQGFESLHGELDRLGLAATEGTRRIRTVTLDERESMLLRLPPAAAALSVTHVFTHRQRRPVQRAESLYRADRYEVHSILHPAT